MFENMADQVLCLPAPFDVFAPDCFPDEPPVVLPPFDIRAAGLAATCGLDRLCTSFWAIFVPAEPGAPEGAHCGDNAGISATVPDPGTRNIAFHPALVARNSTETRSNAMLGWALTFLIVALIAAVLGFGGIAGFAVEIAKIIFFVAIILFVISAIFGLMRGRSPTVP
jgi:uncharacterized membrane protein YtjA (UPF0391 family)